MRHKKTFAELRKANISTFLTDDFIVEFGNIFPNNIDISTIRNTLNSLSRKNIESITTGKRKDNTIVYPTHAIQYIRDNKKYWIVCGVKRHNIARVPYKHTLTLITHLNKLPSEQYNDIVLKAYGDVVEAQPTDASTLTEKLHVPNIKKSKNKRRYSMPQIEAKNRDDFIKWLKKTKSVTTKQDKVDPNKLIPTQKEFNESKVEYIADKKIYKSKAIFVSNDNFILDGHHRWLAAAKDKSHINIFRLNAKLSDCLTYMSEYPKSFAKKLNEAIESNFMKNYEQFILENKKQDTKDESDKVETYDNDSLTSLNEAKKKVEKFAYVELSKKAQKRAKTWYAGIVRRQPNKKMFDKDGDAF